MTTSHLCRIAVGATAGAMFVLGFAGTATAAPVDEVSDCVTVTPTTGWVRQTVWITNGCPTDLSFEVTTTSSRTGCVNVAAGKKGGWRFGMAYTYLHTDEVESC